ncbi:MAG TPA: hypothetical protein VHB77_09035 [Planctomycetaceae bacterium]|nr:hypothetical protein [Planctomycetaceae bacterium]
MTPELLHDCGTPQWEVSVRAYISNCERIVRTIIAAVIAWAGLTQFVYAQAAHYPELGKAQADLTPGEIREKMRTRGNMLNDIKPLRPRPNPSMATTPHERGAAFGIETRQPLAHTKEPLSPHGTAIYGARRPLRKLGIPEPPTLDAHAGPGSSGPAVTPGRTATPTGPIIPGTPNGSIAGMTGQPHGHGLAPGAPGLRTPTPRERLNQMLRLGPDGKPLAFQPPLPILPSVRPIPNRIIGPPASGDPTLPFDQTRPSVPGRMPLTRPNRPLGALPSRSAPGGAPNAGVQPPAGAPASSSPTH